MTVPVTADMVNLAARLHARRSRVFEGSRLDPLYGLTTIADLSGAVRPGGAVTDAVDLQRQMVHDLAVEMAGFLRLTGGPSASLLSWMLARFQLENLRTLLRGHLARTPFEVQRRHLVPLPRDLELDAGALAAAESLPAFIALVPRGRLRESLDEALATYGDRREPFFFEASLDRGYFEELIRRLGPLREDDRSAVRPLCIQEVDAFHLQIAVRGRFQRGLEAELLLPLHVAGSAVSLSRFREMLRAGDPAAAAALAVGRAIDALPPAGADGGGGADIAQLDALSWNRFLRLARRAFRQGHMSLGCIAGYVGIRRVEIANLITVSEAIRIGVRGEPVRARMLPRPPAGGAHV